MSFSIKSTHSYVNPKAPATSSSTQSPLDAYLASASGKDNDTLFDSDYQSTTTPRSKPVYGGSNGLAVRMTPTAAEDAY